MDFYKKRSDNTLKRKQLGRAFTVKYQEMPLRGIHH